MNGLWRHMIYCGVDIMPYQCPKGCLFNAQPLDGCCPTHWEPLFIVEDRHGGTEYEDPTEIGCCALICDVSASMDAPTGFGESQSGTDPSRMDRVAASAAQGIWDLGDISRSSNALLAVIAFAGTARVIAFPAQSGALFVKSAEEIQSHFGNVSQLEKHLKREFTSSGISREATNVSAGLKLAYEIYTAAAQGSLATWGVTGPVQLIEHLMAGKDDRVRTVPNFRAMIYSDGQHNVGPLVNPFATSGRNEVPWALVMTAFIGTDEGAGGSEMKSLAGQCPKHGFANFFLINNSNRYQRLRGLFRMASGASGSCPECLKEGGT